MLILLPDKTQDGSDPLLKVSKSAMMDSFDDALD